MRRTASAIPKAPVPERMPAPMHLCTGNVFAGPPDLEELGLPGGLFPIFIKVSERARRIDSVQVSDHVEAPKEPRGTRRRP